MSRKNKETLQEKEVDWEEVARAIKEPEEIRMVNIFREMKFTPGKVPHHLLSGDTCWKDREKYQDYLRWLRQQGIDWYVFGTSEPHGYSRNYRY